MYSIEKINIIIEKKNEYYYNRKKNRNSNRTPFYRKNRSKMVNNFCYLFFLVHLEDKKNRCVAYLNPTIDIYGIEQYCFFSYSQAKEKRIMSRLDL